MKDLSVTYFHSKLVDIDLRDRKFSSISMVVGHGLYFQNYALTIFMKR